MKTFPRRTSGCGKYGIMRRGDESRMFPSLLVLSFCFQMAESQIGQILPPQNVSLMWINDFVLELSWAPIQDSLPNCQYVVERKNKDPNYEDRDFIPSSPFKPFMAMEGEFLQLSVTRDCDGTKSKTVALNVTYPELVTDLQCYIYSSRQSHCSWLPASHAPQLSFFYRLLNEDLTMSPDDPLPSLQECSSYNYTDGVRTGCDLQAKLAQSIHILFNGTLNDMLVRNTFKKDFSQVRPPPLEWEVKKAGDKFSVSWTPPDIGDLSTWKFIINVTECNKVKTITKNTETSAQLNMVSHCPYCMAIKAERDNGKTPWSDQICFGADTDPNALVYAAILIPLIFAGLVVLALVCCRKNKEKNLPQNTRTSGPPQRYF